MKALVPHYSGKLSKPFWTKVNGLPDGPWKESVYLAGVILQDLEGRVIHLLNRALENKV